jgi:hypothetical protein
MSNYSQRVSSLLFCLLLAGMFFAPGTVFGDSSLAPTTTVSTAISNVHYSLHAADPTRVEAVQFSLAATDAAGQGKALRIKLASASSTWYPCAQVDDGYRCATPDAPAVRDIDQLQLSVLN